MNTKYHSGCRSPMEAMIWLKQQSIAAVMNDKGPAALSGSRRIPP
jgi:hypothetical protein